MATRHATSSCCDDAIRSSSSRTAATTQTLLIPGVSFSLVPRGYLGEALFSRTLYLEVRGSQQRARLRFRLPAGARAGGARVRLKRRIASKWHVLLRGDIGATALSKTSALAPRSASSPAATAACAASAPTTCRPSQQVFEADGITPVLDDDGDPMFEKTGGKHLFAGSVELIRDLRKNFAVAVFGDAGNAFDNFGDPLMYSVGIGVRLRLPAVSVGIDVAQALTTPAGDSDRPGPRLHLNFSPKL